MLALILLILAVLIGLGLTFFANQNPQTVAITIGNLSWAAVPLYLVVTLSLLTGLLVACVFGIINSITSSINLFGKDIKINKTNKINQELSNKIDDLKIENEKLKQQIRVSP